MLSPGLAALKESGGRAKQERVPASVGLLCESRAARLETVSRVVEECGARLYDAGSFAAAEEERHSGGGTILVALDECPEAGTPLAGQIGSLRRAGFVVVCYGDGVRLSPTADLCELARTTA